ncbi:MAG TPA: GNAT family N-acetyltransferase, partial [Anaerolineaceae bacterium]|nr:GNAT family N-acetyltransferase [Anaerolineaceae bacterium]
EQIRLRNERYVRSNDPNQGRMFAIVAGPEKVGVGSIGYWSKEWRGQTVWETGWSVVPESQGLGIASRAILAVLERARADQTNRFIHAFPAVDNGASNAICRKAGFTLLSVVDFEYPPGNWLRCNDWRMDLFAS